MDLTLNVIPCPIPDICESAHERLSPPVTTYGVDRRSLREPKITIIRLACETSHDRGPSARNAKMETDFRQRDLRQPASASLQRVVETQSHLRKRTSFPPTSLPTSQRPSPLPTSSKRPSLPSKKFDSTKHTSNPKKLSKCVKKERMPTIPSTSTISSQTPEHSTRCELRVSPTTPSPRYSTPSTPQKHQMSEQAAESVRVMDWAISLVKSAEKRVRETERATHEKESFDLRSRLREAEMRIQKMGNVEGATEDKKACPGKTRMTARVLWKLERTEMGRFESLLRDANRQCRRGLAVVVER